MNVAVASKSGQVVDQHFGHAERFYIFRVDKGAVELVNEVQVEKYCSYDPDNPLRTNQFQAIVDALSGCQLVLTAMIGEHPRQELARAGLKHCVAAGPVEQAVLAAVEGAVS